MSEQNPRQMSDEFISAWIAESADNIEKANPWGALEIKEHVAVLREAARRLNERGDVPADTCPHCKGSAIYEDDWCPTCDGTGNRSIPSPT